MIDVSVYCIIVTYNGMRWIERCLESVFRSTQPVHVIVVDNSSSDKTVSFIKEKYPDIYLIQLEKNIGFGQANNIGLSIALQKKATNILLLNQDVYIETDTIKKLVAAQLLNPEFGIISPIHANGNNTDFDSNFYTYFIQSDIRTLITDSVLKISKNEQIINTKFVNAAAWLISKNCLENTGGFDPIFFHYGEDDNYAKRVLYKGFKIGILVGAKVYHDRNVLTSSYHHVSNFHFKRDSVILLNQACDINQVYYKALLLKRILRHCGLCVTNILLLNSKHSFYHLAMAKFALGCFRKAKNSRNKALKNDTPYLQHSLENRDVFLKSMLS